MLIREANDKSGGSFIEEAVFALIQKLPASLLADAVIAREIYWKRCLGTRVYGLNATYSAYDTKKPPALAGGFSNYM